MGLIAGYLAGGFEPLAGPGGAPISVGRGIALVWSSAGLVALPLLGLAAFAIFLSATTQSSLGAGVGAIVLVLLLRLASSLGLAGALDPYLLTNQCEAWLNLTRDPINWEPIIRSAWVSPLWAATFLVAAWAVFAPRRVELALNFQPSRRLTALHQKSPL